MTRNISRAVVTGPTGAIGSALCLELANNNITVYAVCRPGSHRATSLSQHPNIIPLYCDIADLESLSLQIPGGADAFFHLAWANTIGPGRNDMPSQIDNIHHTIHAVHSAKKLGCQIFLGAGSQAEYGRVEGLLTSRTPCSPENGYGIAKLCAGQMSRIECAKLGIDHIWVRILSIYGPGDSPHTMISNVIRQLLHNERPALTEGIQNWDYLYSADAASAFRLLAMHGTSGMIYPLGSGNVRPLREYVEILRDAVDPSLPLGFGEIPYGPQQVMHLQADITQLKQDTGFSPCVSFDKGIQLTIDSIRKK